MLPSCLWQAYVVPLGPGASQKPAMLIAVYIGLGSAEGREFSLQFEADLRLVKVVFAVCELRTVVYTEVS